LEVQQLLQPGPRGDPLVVDAYRVLHPQSNPAGTFTGFAESDTGVRIDYVFCGPRLRATAAEIIRTRYDGRLPSDHYPVLVRFRYGQEE
jgi:exonuclease III